MGEVNTHPILKIISSIDVNKLELVGLRLNSELSVPIDQFRNYSKITFAKHFGPNYDLDRIYLPNGKNKCVHINTSNQTKLVVTSSIKENDNWIEIEEFPKPKEGQTIVRTTYVHSFFNIKEKKCKHIDCSINFYDSENYNEMYNNMQLKKAKEHIKVWLVEGILDINEWGQLVLTNFEETDLLKEIFTGRNADEIFDRFIYLLKQTYVFDINMHNLLEVEIN